MKFYISGPITGYVDKNKPKFDEAAVRLRELGHTAINPFDLDLIEPCDPLDWYANMKRDLKYLPLADSILLLPDWELSKGALLEIALAKGLDMEFFKFNETNELIDQHIISIPSVYSLE